MNQRCCAGVPFAPHNPQNSGEETFSTSERPLRLKYPHCAVPGSVPGSVPRPACPWAFSNQRGRPRAKGRRQPCAQSSCPSPRPALQSPIPGGQIHCCVAFTYPYVPSCLPLASSSGSQRDLVPFYLLPERAQAPLGRDGQTNACGWAWPSARFVNKVLLARFPPPAVSLLPTAAFKLQRWSWAGGECSGDHVTQKAGPLYFLAFGEDAHVYRQLYGLFGDTTGTNREGAPIPCMPCVFVHTGLCLGRPSR